MTWEAEAAEEALNHEPDHSCCDEGDREMITGNSPPDVNRMQAEHDMLLTLLADLARRNGGKLTFSLDRVFDSPPLPFEFIQDDATRSVTFRVYEAE